MADVSMADEISRMSAALAADKATTDASLAQRDVGNCLPHSGEQRSR